MSDLPHHENGSRDRPFRAGRMYRVEHNFAGLEDRFHVGELLTFLRDDWNGDEKTTTYFFRDLDGGVRRWVLRDADSADRSRVLFKAVGAAEQRLREWAARSPSQRRPWSGWFITASVAAGCFIVFLRGRPIFWPLALAFVVMLACYSSGSPSGRTVGWFFLTSLLLISISAVAFLFLMAWAYHGIRG